jgi:hypothetical protein
VAGSSADQPVSLTIELTEVAHELDKLISGYESRRAFQVRPTTPDPARLQVVCFVDDGSKVLQALELPLHPPGAQEGSRK